MWVRPLLSLWINNMCPLHFQSYNSFQYPISQHLQVCLPDHCPAALQLMKDLFRTRSHTHITCFPITVFGIQNLRFPHARDCSCSMTKHCCHSCFTLRNAHTSSIPWDFPIQYLDNMYSQSLVSNSDKNTNYWHLAKLWIETSWRKPRMFSMLRQRIMERVCRTYTTCCKW